METGVMDGQTVIQMDKQTQLQLIVWLVRNEKKFCKFDNPANKFIHSHHFEPIKINPTFFLLIIFVLFQRAWNKSVCDLR